MHPSHTFRFLFALALIAISITAAPAAWAQTVITNGTVTLGVNPEGHLIVDGVLPSAVFGQTRLGLRLNETNLEALAHGSPCEGWGVGLFTGSPSVPAFSGWANRCFDGPGEGGPVNNLTVPLGGFTFTPSSATSVTRIQQGGVDKLEVTHNFFPLPFDPNLYQIDVTITNISGGPLGNPDPASRDLRYRRVMDWDVEPTISEEFVTIGGLPASHVVHTGDDGFEIADPLQFEFGSPIDVFRDLQIRFGVSPALPCAPPDGFLVNFTQCGEFVVDPGTPDELHVVPDHGAIFDFGFPGLADGETRSFSLYYGAATTSARADEALYIVGAEVYSYGQCRPLSADGEGDASCDLATGAPTTFIFAATLVGGVPVFGDIHGNVYDDNNNSGDLNPGDTFIPGVTVSLTGTTTDGASVSRSVVTDHDGFYFIPALLAGTYSVSTPAALTGPHRASNTTNPLTITLGRGEFLTAFFGYRNIETTTDLTSSNNPSVVGQSVTFTAKVVNHFNPVSTGVVTFRDGTTVLDTVPVNGSGEATYTTSALTVGTHSISATYDDSPSSTPQLRSSSDSLEQVVGPAMAATTTTVESSANPSVFGQSVTFTATVSPAAPATGTPTGSVTFRDDATIIGTAVLNASGQASFTTSALSVGTHPITAQYNGDTGFTSSISAPLNQVVNQGSTTTGLTSSLNPSGLGQSVTFTATVSPVAPATGTPTGSVTFRDDATIIGTAVLNASGQASFTTSALSVGTHPITAQYSGDTTFTGSTSPVVNQVVQAATTTAVASSLNPSALGQSVTFTATVTSALGPVTEGTVTFREGATVLAGPTALNAAGQASFSTSTLSVGSHTITATYNGTARFTTSSGSVVQRVNAPNAAPVCTQARPSIREIWPPNHKMVDVRILGVTDPNGDAVSIRITRILQDEPTNTTGDGNTTIDAGGIGTSTASVRAERSGNRNGRVYEIQFTGTDTSGATCSGKVLVSVPHDQGPKGRAIDDGIRYDSTTGARVSSHPKPPHDKDGHHDKDEHHDKDDKDGHHGDDRHDGKDGRHGDDRHDGKDGHHGDDRHDGKDGRYGDDRHDGKDERYGDDRQDGKDGHSNKYGYKK